MGTLDYITDRQLAVSFLTLMMCTLNFRGGGDKVQVSARTEREQPANVEGVSICLNKAQLEFFTSLQLFCRFEAI